MRAQLPCLPLIQERFWNEIKNELDDGSGKKYYPEFEMTMFMQTWGSTALGFGGIGGQAMTNAYTTVVREEYSGWVGVFFGESLAYKINNPNQKFYEDMKDGNMQPTYKASVYRRSDREKADDLHVNVEEEVKKYKKTLKFMDKIIP